MSSSSKITPSYYGYVGSTNDALLIIQAVIEKQLDPIPRRPHERERPSLIKSGNVFVFVEEQSGIKRWTDGVAWSPSRILGRFLVYRELDKHSLSEKDDKKKKKRKSSFDQDPLDLKQLMPPAQQLLQQAEPYNDEFSKQLVGSLSSSYVYKDQGLIKKTLSLSLAKPKDLKSSLLYNAAAGAPGTTTATAGSAAGDKKKNSDKYTIHLISYYNADDVLNGKLQRPSFTDLKDLPIPNELWSAIKESSLGGKIPIEDEAFYFLDTNYQLQNMSSLLQHHQHPGMASGAPSGGQSGLPHPPPPHHQHMLQPGLYLSQQQGKYAGSGGQPPMLLPIPVQQLGDEIQQQQQQQQQSQSQGAMLPPPQGQGQLVNELTFINPFTGTAQTGAAGSNASASANSYGFGVSTGSGVPYYNNYLSPQQQQFALQQHNNYVENPQSTASSSFGGSNYPQPNFPPFPQHFQQMYPQPQQPPQPSQPSQQIQPHGSILNSSEYSMGGNSNGSISSIGSTVVEGGNGAGGGSISSVSGAPPSSLSKKGRNSIGHSNWFTTSSNPNPGGYVAPPPPQIGLGQPLGDSGLHHHPHHHQPGEEAGSLTYVTSNYGGAN